MKNKVNRKTSPVRSGLLWYLGNHNLWDKLTKRKPPALEHANIVVHAPNHLGDNIMAIPFVMALLRQDANVTIITRSEYSVIWKTLNSKLNVISYEGWYSKDIRRLKRTLIDLECDMAFLLATGMEVSWLYLRAGVKHRLGYDYWGRGFLLTARLHSFHQPTSEHLVTEHFSDNMLKLLTLLPQQDGFPDQVMKSPWLMKKFTVDRKRKVILGLALGGNTPDKSPPAEFWQSIIKLSNVELELDEIYLLGTGDQYETGKQLLEKNEGIRNMCGETNVESLMESLLECDAVISPDSGIAHLASAMGVSTLVFFTSGSPVWTRPAGESVEVIESAVACSPCFNMNRCNQSYQCVEKLDTLSFLTGLQKLNKAALTVNN